MPEYYARNGAELGCSADRSVLERSAEGCEVSQASLPELTKLARQRSAEARPRRSGAAWFRTVCWRRIPISEMLVTSFLLALTAATYWALSGGNSLFSLPGDQQTMVPQVERQEREFLALEELTSFPDFAAQEAREAMPLVPGMTSQATSNRITLGQVIVQPELPALTARRPVKSGKELSDGELRRDLRPTR